MERKNNLTKKIIYAVICINLFFQQIGFAQASGELNIAGYLGRMQSSISIDKFRPLHLRYFSYDLNRDNFKFLFDKGDLKQLDEAKFKQQSAELLKYFLIGITIPDSKFWVNLRPDSENQIIDPELEQTDIGRVLLEADLQLKKDTARWTSPETVEGREYWNRLYKKAEELFGYENITIPTLTRPWIVPGEIIVAETQDSAFIYKSTLKVMLEEDYLKSQNSKLKIKENLQLANSRTRELNTYSTQLIKELIIPKLTKEVNISKKYAGLRQVFYSLILSRWFKARFGDAGAGLAPARNNAGDFIHRINSNDLTGLTSKTSWSKETYFKQYQKSFTEGEYNIKEPVHTPTGQVIRSYFSGGIEIIPEQSWAGFRGAGESNLYQVNKNLISGELGHGQLSEIAGSPISIRKPDKAADSKENLALESIKGNLRILLKNAIFLGNEEIKKLTGNYPQNTDEIEEYKQAVQILKDEILKMDSDYKHLLLTPADNKIAQDLFVKAGKLMRLPSSSAVTIDLSALRKRVNTILSKMDKLDPLEIIDRDKWGDAREIERKKDLIIKNKDLKDKIIAVIAKHCPQIFPEDEYSLELVQRYIVKLITEIDNLDRVYTRFIEDSMYYHAQGKYKQSEEIKLHIKSISDKIGLAAENLEKVLVSIEAVMEDKTDQVNDSSPVKAARVMEEIEEEFKMQGGKVYELGKSAIEGYLRDEIVLQEAIKYLVTSQGEEQLDKNIAKVILVAAKQAVKYNLYGLARSAIESYLTGTRMDHGIKYIVTSDPEITEAKAKEILQEADKMASAGSTAQAQAKENNSSPIQIQKEDDKNKAEAFAFIKKLQTRFMESIKDIPDIGSFWLWDNVKLFDPSVYTESSIPCVKHILSMLVEVSKRYTPGNGGDILKGVVDQVIQDRISAGDVTRGQWERIKYNLQVLLDSLSIGWEGRDNKIGIFEEKFKEIGEALEKALAASSAITPGGIDFSLMNIIAPPLLASSSIDLNLPQLANLSEINLDDELQQIQKMVSSGIVPCGERVRKYLAACQQKGQWYKRLADIVSCLVDVCRLSEDNLSEIPLEIKQALIIAG